MSLAWIDAIRPTTLVPVPSLERELGLRLCLASEIGQHTGSFKFRAAYHLASSVPQTSLLTASSGNFGQALAYACKLLGKSCRVVMPMTSARVKIEAVRAYGGLVDLLDTREKSRAARVAELALEHPEAYVASAYDDPFVIEGNSSLGAELAAAGFDTVIAPVGGGGLSSGLVLGLRRTASPTRVVGAEPLLANDAARSLREGRIVAQEQEPQTVADGARTLSLGTRNWEILREGLHGIVEVPEEAIATAMRLLRDHAGLRAEPTGALSLAALLVAPDRFRGQSLCCVVSGGNVDSERYESLISGVGSEIPSARA